MTKVSVIIPVYNVEKYLRQCLDSVIAQTLTDIEIICVNDGSPDNSRAILQEYADKDARIKIIDKENGGLSSARNVGIMAATGEYIGFLDSDDWVANDFYEKLYDVAHKYDADVACGDLLRIVEKEEKYLIKYDKTVVATKPNKSYALTDLPRTNYVMNRIYRTSRMQKGKFLFEPGILFEDILYSHKIMYYFKKVVSAVGAIYYYRDTPFSIVNNETANSEFQFRRELYKAACFVQQHSIFVRDKKAYQHISKVKYKLLGVPIWKVEKYCYFTIHYLFSLFPVFETINTKWHNDIKDAK